jgi:hypothetical protein
VVLADVDILFDLMAVLACGIIIGLGWLTFLTHKKRQQQLEIRKLVKQNRSYRKQITKLKSKPPWKTF